MALLYSIDAERGEEAPTEHSSDDRDQAHGAGLRATQPLRATFSGHLFILPISSNGYTLTVESSPASPTALAPLGDPG